MNVKIDTKEKFHEIYLLDEHISANMTVDLEQLLSELQNTPPASVVLSMDAVKTLDTECAKTLAIWQGKYYENSQSFVICHLQPEVEKLLDEAELLEVMNVTPTLSEAWDIVQMEEIERELLDGFED
jgi:anti-anti-sigma regulatory factor